MSRGPRPPAGCRLVQSTAKPRLGKLRGRLKGFLESLREPSQPACAQGSLACGLRVLEREPARLAQPRRAGGTSTLASQGGAGGPPCPLRRSRRHHRAQGASRPRDRPPFASLPCSASRAAPATQRSVPTALPRPLAAPGCPALLPHSGRRLRTCARGRTAVFSLRCRFLRTLRSRRTKSQKSSRCGRRAAAPGLAAQSISALNPRTGICFSDYGVQARGALGSEGQGAQGAAAGPPPAPALAAPPSCRAPGWPRPAGWSSAMCTSPSSRGGARTAVPPGAGGGARLGPAVPGEPPRGGSQGAGWWPRGHLAGTLRPARLPQWLLGSLV